MLIHESSKKPTHHTCSVSVHLTLADCVIVAVEMTERERI